MIEKIEEKAYRKLNSPHVNEERHDFDNREKPKERYLLL